MGNTASLVKNIVTQKKYKEKYHWTDYFSYFYLFLGFFIQRQNINKFERFLSQETVLGFNSGLSYFGGPVLLDERS